MSSTPASNDAKFAKRILRIIVFFLIAVVLAGLTLIVLSDFLVGI